LLVREGPPDLRNASDSTATVNARDASTAGINHVPSLASPEVVRAIGHATFGQRLTEANVQNENDPDLGGAHLHVVYRLNATRDEVPALRRRVLDALADQLPQRQIRRMVVVVRRNR
jgi:hypothetical protein